MNRAHPENEALSAVMSLNRAREYHALPPPHALTGSLREFQGSEHGADFARLCNLFPTDWGIYVMGGLVRNLRFESITGARLEPADVDVVIDGAGSVAAVRDRLGGYYVSRNSFGGAKCRLRPGGAIFDVWRIQDHTNIAAAPDPHTIEQLLRHNLLDIDAILWDVYTDCLHECGCEAAIRAGTIGLMGEEGIAAGFLADQAAHVLLIAFQTRLSLSQRAQDFIRTACDTGKREALIRICNRKLPRASDEIEYFLNEVLSGAVRQ